jgi:hypothetical protein
MTGWSGRVAMGTILALVVLPAGALATHGVSAMRAVVEAERLATGADGKGCQVAGAVRNPNPVTVTARLAWLASDTAGTALGLATVRVSRLAPGERRSFVSSPFMSVATGQVVPACAAVLRIERVEAAADPAP